MTLREWWIHFKQWFKSFPGWGMEEHMWVSAAGEDEHDCWICGSFALEDEDGNLHKAPRPIGRDSLA